MLKNSFIVLPKVKHKKEQNIWQQNILDWNDFCDAKKVKGFSAVNKERADKHLKYAGIAARESDAKELARIFPNNEHWRLYDEFRDEAVFLDIETAGYYGSITVIGLYDGDETKTFVRGYNLDKKLFERELRKHKMVITFNGSSFDLPVIKRFFRTVVRVPHVDLRFVCQKIGLVGGLKSIEKQLGIKREEEVEGISGEDAAILWELFKTTRNPEHLKLLVKYNEEDIINLKPLADYAVRELWRRTFYHSRAQSFARE